MTTLSENRDRQDSWSELEETKKAAVWEDRMHSAWLTLIQEVVGASVATVGTANTAYTDMAFVGPVETEDMLPSQVNEQEQE